LIKRLLLYMFRWQLSTPILAPVVAWFSHSESLFGTKESWIGSAIANVIGSLIFFAFDRFIFTSEKIGTVWHVKDNITCVDCGKIARGYRLVKLKNYDRSKATPEFRCECCSIKKNEAQRKNGVEV